jgi:hypothetical protein
MHLSALLDCDLVAVEQTDELTLLVELTAPTPPPPPPSASPRRCRSSSTAAARCPATGVEGAKSALISLVDRLDAADIYNE